MKRSLITILIFFVSINLFAQKRTEKDFSHYENFKIEQRDFRHGENLDSILRNFSSFYVFYKIEVYDQIPYISELYYVLRTNKANYLLGGFEKGKGFFNGEYETVFNKFVGSDEFIRNNLLGLSIYTLRDPFSLRGIAIASDGDVYETEYLINFTVDSENPKLEVFRFKIE